MTKTFEKQCACISSSSKYRLSSFIWNWLGDFTCGFLLLHVCMYDGYDSYLVGKWSFEEVYNDHGYNHILAEQ